MSEYTNMSESPNIGILSCQDENIREWCEVLENDNVSMLVCQYVRMSVYVSMSVSMFIAMSKLTLM